MKGKRGPKFKPATLHHTPRLYKHAPDVTKIMDQVPAGQRSRFVDNAIRLFYKKMALNGKTAFVDYANVTDPIRPPQANKRKE